MWKVVTYMDYNKIEDTVLKKAMEVFKQSAVNFFGINTKIIAAAETEIKNIEIKTNYTDYLFYTEDGNYLHFEFQTTNKRDDIKRFLYYDASLFYKKKRKVRTMVIYSSDIDDVEEYIDAGTIKYSVEPFYMRHLNGDEKLEYLQNKIKKKLSLTNEDILSLTFLPLMKSKSSKSDRAIKSIEMVENIEDEATKLQCVSMLYALLDKFGDESSREKLKELINMTEIGKMIRDEALKEGIKEGEAKGKAKGKADIVIMLLSKKFKELPDKYVIEIKKLSEKDLDAIATDIFEIEKVEDLERYF